MIDAYEMLRDKIKTANMPNKLGLAPHSYGVVTLHRPSNVDSPEAFGPLVDMLASVAQRIRIIFPIHPRTRSRLDDFGLRSKLEAAGIILTEPMGYIEFQSLIGSCQFVLTDSGGIQEETTYLSIPCLTVRTTTERPITIIEGSNRLIAPEGVLESVEKVLNGQWPLGHPPSLWDGKTAIRVAQNLRDRSGF